MARNIEIKARVPDELFAALRKRARELATGGPIQLVQTDTFFNAQQGRLKLREFEDGSAELIFYQRPDSQGPKTSNYVLAKCDGASMKAALSGALGIAGVVSKQREVFFIEQTRVHLDQVEGLGTYLELEVVLEDQDSIELGEAITNRLMQELSIDESQLVSGAYFDLLAASSPI